MTILEIVQVCENKLEYQQLGNSQRATASKAFRRKKPGPPLYASFEFLIHKDAIEFQKGMWHYIHPQMDPQQFTYI